jgi:hypothetical protein
MQRQSGWYLVKMVKKGQPTIAYYYSDIKEWRIWGHPLLEFYKSKVFYKIYPERIKSPKEK